MKALSSIGIARVVLTGIVLFIATLGIIIGPDSALGGLSGEQSIGTWLSELLLAISIGIIICISVQRQRWIWGILALFFLVVAVDERFMIHEQMKQWIILSSHSRLGISSLKKEIAVILGAIIGGGVILCMVVQMSRKNSLFILIAAFWGIVSVVLDIINIWVFYEDASKLLAELFLVLGLLGEIVKVTKFDNVEGENP